MPILVYEFAPVEYRDLSCIGFPNYRVGNDGTVWTRIANKYHLGPWKLKKPYKNRDGRLYVSLYNDGLQTTFSVHRLVLEAFVGPRPKGMEACHFPDPSPLNNTLKNLRWDTPSNNQKDRIVHGTYQYGEKNRLSKLNDVMIAEMQALREQGLSYAKIGRMYSVCAQAAWNAINNKTYQYGKNESTKEQQP